jgi:hypothetical protein
MSKLIMAFSLILLAQSIQLSAWAQEAIGKISTIKPRKNFALTLTRKGSPLTDSKKNTAIMVGDVIETGAKTQVILRFNDGNTLLVRGSSKLTVEVYEDKAKGRIRTEGIIHGLIDNNYESNADSYFEFTSESAIAGVRGSIIGVHVNPQSQKMTAFLQEGSKPAYIRQPGSTALTDFQPNSVASSSTSGVQVVDFNPQVHSALQLPPEIVQAVETQDAAVLETAMESNTELDSANTEGLNTDLPSEVPATEGQDSINLNLEDSSGESFFPEFDSDERIGSLLNEGRGLLGLFRKMRKKKVKRPEVEVDSVELFEFSPTKNKLKEFKTQVENIGEKVNKENKTNRDVENSKVKVKLTFE